jgi:hypothetical protein
MAHHKHCTWFLQRFTKKLPNFFVVETIKLFCHFFAPIARIFGLVVRNAYFVAEI